jgi:hypothetical protein
MFTYETYKLLHLVGLILVFLGFGGLLLGSRDADADAPPSRMAMILHGVGMLVMLVAGFGVLARMSISWSWPWPGWVFAKFGAWLLIGALPVLYKRRLVPPIVVLVIAIAIGVTAAWIAINKPF